MHQLAVRAIVLVSTLAISKQTEMHLTAHRRSLLLAQSYAVVADRAADGFRPWKKTNAPCEFEKEIYWDHTDDSTAIVHAI